MEALVIPSQQLIYLALAVQIATSPSKPATAAFRRILCNFYHFGILIDPDNRDIFAFVGIAPHHGGHVHHSSGPTTPDFAVNVSEGQEEQDE